MYIMVPVKTHSLKSVLSTIFLTYAKRMLKQLLAGWPIDN